MPVQCSPHVASMKYVEKYRDTMEHQRQAFEAERSLWNIERAELLEKVAALEKSLCRYQTSSSRKGVLPIEKRSSAPTIIYNQQNRRNPTPAHTWPELSDQPGIAGEQLPSIAENEPTRKSSRHPFHPFQARFGFGKNPSNVSPSGNTFDGITFKADTVNAPFQPREVPVSDSPSPLESTSGSTPCQALLPAQLELPHAGLDAPDNLTKDAGHTPLARHPEFTSDSQFSAHSSDVATPNRVEQERPPLEPHVSTTTRPTEHSNSYFPQIESVESDENDPELREPLCLKNCQSGDNQFLSELDTKLAEASKAAEEKLSWPNTSDTAEVNESSPPKQVDGESLEEPKLKIKRSMNFGSQLGSLH
ncbi:MAG: hypothetical protein Q9190_002669 [Brigantiaea leucoxantha]